MAGRKTIAITERQFGVLRVLWEHGPLTVRALMEHLPRGDDQPYTTALGLLQGMEKAGLVAHDKQGQAHVYRPVLAENEATGHLLADFVGRFFRGSAERLVLGLVDARQLEPEAMRAIEARLAEQSVSPGAGASTGASAQAEEAQIMSLTTWVDGVVAPGLAVLVGWSLRWGLLIALLAAWFAVRSPRRATTRHSLCVAVLAAGLLTPLVPHWETRWVVPRWAASVPARPTKVESQGTSIPLAPSGSALTANRDEGAGAQPELAPGRARAARPEPRFSPAPSRLNVWRVLTLGIAGCWLAGLAWGAARFAVAFGVLARLRRSVRPAGEETCRLLVRCANELTLRRPAEIAAHPEVRAPVALGGRRPLILVPSDWDNLPASAQRACLLHELAHLARHDDLVKLARELVRVPFFFHPLVAWLFARMDRESELLCDEAVVGRGVHPRDFARLLLDFARRGGGLQRCSSALGRQTLAFFDRGTVQHRIARLLEDDMTRTNPPLSMIRIVGLCMLVAVLALPIGALGVRAVEQDAPGEGRSAVAAAATTTKSAPKVEEIVKDAPDEVVLKGPTAVAPDELAGVIVDAQGKSLEGVRVDAYYWIPKPPTTTTNKEGLFRLAKLPVKNDVPIRLSKEGYENQFIERTTGEPGWVDILGNGTYFEGRVLAPDGAPVTGALIRADAGPRRRPGHVLSGLITETTSGPDGHYRLYVVSGQYDIAVRSPGAGVGRLPVEAIAADQHRALDIKLAPGVDFVARLVDHETGKPVPGVRLSHWQRPGIEGSSDAEGVLHIRDTPPGDYPRFQLEPKGYTRWWSDACTSEFARYQKEARHGFQRNFDGLDFAIRPGMGAVTIELERGATVRGRVLDPDGKPVAAATVAPALTGSGNSLTGDTRFSVETDGNGRFEVLLPASGAIGYNLVAHDGQRVQWSLQWRNWANGVTPPFKTTPGQVIEDLEIRLNRPGTVTGRVVDAQGHPVAGREVRSQPTSKDEHRYYDPTTETKADGTFTLRFVRPGEHHIQVAPFWLDAAQAPRGTSQIVTITADQTTAGVELKASPRR